VLLRQTDADDFRLVEDAPEHQQTHPFSAREGGQERSFMNFYPGVGWIQSVPGVGDATRNLDPIRGERYGTIYERNGWIKRDRHRILRPPGLKGGYVSPGSILRSRRRRMRAKRRRMRGGLQNLAEGARRIHAQKDGHQSRSNAKLTYHVRYHRIL